MSARLKAGLLIAVPLFLAAPAAVQAQDQDFFQQVVGAWSGPGEIVAGKYKGTKFVCSFTGAQPAKAVGMALDGTCRVGIFSQKMRAEVTKQGGSYKGAFLDGAKGKGLDIISGSVVGGKMVVGLDRKALKGAMVARLDGADTLNISVSVRVAEELVPVIGMSLKRGEALVKQTALEE